MAVIIFTKLPLVKKFVMNEQTVHAGLFEVRFWLRPRPDSLRQNAANLRVFTLALDIWLYQSGISCHPKHKLKLSKAFWNLPRRVTVSSATPPRRFNRIRWTHSCPPTRSASFALREGLVVRGLPGQPDRGRGRNSPPLAKIETVSGMALEKWVEVKSFDKLTPINPKERFVFETTPDIITMRVVDLLTPIGKGQRALIVSPPRSGKTTLLQQMAAAITKNHPETYLIVLLIDERPEEVTDWRPYRQRRGDRILQ